MARLLTDRVEAAYAGLDVTSSPEEVDEAHAPVHTNLLVHRKGQMVMRGPLIDSNEHAIGTDEIIVGAWTFNDSSLIGLMDKDPSAFHEPWEAPYTKPTAAALAEPSNTMKYYSGGGGGTSDVAAGQTTVISGVGARLGSYVYGHAYSYSADITQNGGAMHLRRILRWDGTTAVPTAYANAPDGGQAVVAHLNRLWVLGGRDVPGGGSAIEMNSLYWSDYGGPTADTTAMWQNDVTGLTNKLIVDSDDGGDFGTALARVGQDLVIFKRRSIHVLYGYSDDTFTLRPISRSVGCIDQFSVAETENGVYFMSENGYMFFDGSTVRPVDVPIRDELLPAALEASGVWGDTQNSGRVCATPMPNNYLLLTSGVSNSETGVVVGSRVGYLFHTPTERWTHIKFDDAIFQGEVPLMHWRTSSFPFIFDGDRITEATYLTLPELAPATYRGLDTAFLDVVRIPVEWNSRMIRLATPSHMSQLHRVFVDYRLQANGEVAEGVNGFVLSIYDDSGEQLLADTTLPLQADPMLQLARYRYVTDVFTEASAIQIRLSYPESAVNIPGLERAEIYDCWIEYQEARQRRTTS